MSKAFRAAFHRLVHRLRPRPVGSRLMIARYRHLRAACSVGKWPRALTARRSRALIDSIALVTGMKMPDFAGSLAACLWRGRAEPPRVSWSLCQTRGGAPLPPGPRPHRSATIYATITMT